MKQDKTDIKNRLKAALGLDPATSKIIVVGLGVTGISVVHFLAALDFDFVVADSREQPDGLTKLQEEMENLIVFTGQFDHQLFCQASHLVVSPGVTLSEKAIQQAANQGVKIIGDIDLFACSVTAPIVAITGTNGKSTVTTMLGEMAAASGKKVGVGGNLGLAALDLLEDYAELYVLELSSFQLERTNQLNAVAAVVLNVTADHLDRHSDIDDYARQKQRVYEGDGVMVINADDPIVTAMKDNNRATLTFSIQNKADFWIREEKGEEYLMHDDTPLMPLSDLPVEGRHNAANVLAALALGTAVGLGQSAMCAALKVFKGLQHRMQCVAKIAGVTWVNDSKATNIGACVAALQGYDRKVILIVGGDAKGADMNELAPSVKEKASCVILMGKDAGKIERALHDSVPVHKASNMKEAVRLAADAAKSGDTVLLSPACASLDQYKNYQDRGDQFINEVLSLDNNNLAGSSLASVVAL